MNIQTAREHPIFLALSGPAGVGKTTLCDKLLGKFSGVKRVITATTRVQRPGEKEGVDYYYLSNEEFEKKIKQGALYEYARVHGRYYGILKEKIQIQFRQNVDLLINIDVQGAETLRAASMKDEELARRLVTV